jgi:hypothetical protein
MAHLLHVVMLGPFNNDAMFVLRTICDCLMNINECLIVVK